LSRRHKDYDAWPARKLVQGGNVLVNRGLARPLPLDHTIIDRPGCVEDSDPGTLLVDEECAELLILLQAQYKRTAFSAWVVAASRVRIRISHILGLACGSIYIYIQCRIKKTDNFALFILMVVLRIGEWPGLQRV